MASERPSRTTSLLAVLLGFCVAASLLDVLSTSPSSYESSSHRLRRSLQAQLKNPPSPDQRQQQSGTVGGVYPWARSNLRPLDAVPDPEREVALFWHIPRSGGITIKSLYECLGRTIAHSSGVDPRFGYHNDEAIVAFRPWPGVSRASLVNVDTITKPGIERARKLGLVSSGLVDLILTSNPRYAIEKLYDESHKGRVLALFRHPVDRLVSKFYYLRDAAWEQQYRPQWKRIDVLEYARRNTDNNHMVKRLAGLGVNDTATGLHLKSAMNTIKKRFVVGLMDNMDESVHRFNVVMGVDETDGEVRQCVDHFVYHSVGAKRHESNSQPHVEQGSATWNALAKRNALDVKLYEFIEKLFDEQGQTIETYANSVDVQRGIS